MTRFIVKCSYLKTFEDGRQKKVSEQILVDAETYADAGARAYENMDGLEEINVKKVAEANVDEVIVTEDSDVFYNAKVVFTSLNEKNGTEKKTAYNWIVLAKDFDSAYKAVMDNLKGIMAYADVVGITETKIVKYLKNNEE